MAAILPAGLVPAEEPHTHLVDECRRLKGEIPPFPGEVPQGQAMQLVVNERHELLERQLVTAAPSSKQTGDVAW